MQAIILMEKRLLKLILPAVLVVLACTNCQINKVPGYVVTLQGDTIKGRIRLPKVDQLTYSLYLKGHDMDSFFEKVFFREKDKRKCETYFPGSIKQFGFTFRTDDYCYASFPITYHSLVKSEKTVDRFMKQLHKGKINLYMVKHRVRVPKQVVDYHLVCYRTELFLQNNALGPVRLALDDDHSDFKHLLLGFGMEEEFAVTLPGQINVEDIPRILQDYDDWLLKTSIIYQ
ncbi:MAG: hypothetical protein QM786_17585 [Breznakibacter sp.]